jgi:hypothetical protein
MPDDNAVVVRALFDAFNDGDLARAATTVTDAFQLIDLAGGQTFTAPTAVGSGCRRSQLRQAADVRDEPGGQADQRQGVVARPDDPRRAVAAP